MRVTVYSIFILWKLNKKQAAYQESRYFKLLSNLKFNQDKSFLILVATIQKLIHINSEESRFEQDISSNDELIESARNYTYIKLFNDFNNRNIKVYNKIYNIKYLDNWMVDLIYIVLIYVN